MQGYKLTKAARFGDGDVLGLSDKQIEPRAHALEIVNEESGGAIVKVKAPVEFKAGEIVGLDELPKRMADAAELLQPESRKGKGDKAAA